MFGFLGFYIKQLCDITDIFVTKNYIFTFMFISWTGTQSLVSYCFYGEYDSDYIYIHRINL